MLKMSGFKLLLMKEDINAMISITAFDHEKRIH
jgi:hypothetical protein